MNTPWKNAATRMIEECIIAGCHTKSESMRIRYAWIAAVGIGRLLTGEKRVEVMTLINAAQGKYRDQFLTYLRGNAILRGRL